MTPNIYLDINRCPECGKKCVIFIMRNKAQGHVAVAGGGALETDCVPGSGDFPEW